MGAGRRVVRVGDLTRLLAHVTTVAARLPEDVHGRTQVREVVASLGTFRV